MTNDPLITIDHLRTWFDTDEGVVKAVDDVSLVIPKGKTLGLVGESGCGKSVTAMSVIRLISPPGRIAGGRITLHKGTGSFFGPQDTATPQESDGRKMCLSPSPSTKGDSPIFAADTADSEEPVLSAAKIGTVPIVLTDLPESEMRKIRGGSISMIFQEPMTSLNPVFTIGSQIVEAIRLHQKVGQAEARRRAIEMLQKVRIPEPQQRMREYPHQFSGGMRQRAMIAMALACNPRLLIADEPTTALDVTIQAQILDLLRQLQADVGMSILFITHDLGVICEMADDVAVMYASKVVEYTSVRELFANPLHPYSHLLFRSRPKPGHEKERKLDTIEGMVPSPLRFPTGCKFHPRCPFRQSRCETEEPELREIRPGHQVRCHFAGQLNFEM